MSTGIANDLIKNAIGRHVPTYVNGRETAPYQGVNGYQPVGNKAGPPIRSNRDYPVERRQACSRPGNRATAVRAARWHDHQQSSSSAQR